MKKKKKNFNKKKLLLIIIPIILLGVVIMFGIYINRKNYNFLIDLNRYPDKISNESLDDLLKNEMLNNEVFYKYAFIFKLAKTLKMLHSQKLAKDIIIYYPYETNYAKKYLDDLIGCKNRFIYNFEEILDITGYNSTYFLSDHRHLYTMRDKGCLKMSSITLPMDYNYNMIDNKLVFNFDELYKEHPFKLSYCRACTED